MERSDDFTNMEVDSSVKRKKGREKKGGGNGKSKRRLGGRVEKMEKEEKTNASSL